MPETRTQPLPDEAANLIEGLEGFSAVRKPRARKPEQVKVEPTMRALRRILGDDVLNIFPEGLTEQVDKLYQFCSEDAELWPEIEFDTESERNDTLALMRAYAECAGTTGYTVRQDRTTEPNVLRFRVTNRRGSGTSEGVESD